MTLTREQALDAFASDDLIGIGMEADAMRRAQHPEGVVTYVMEAAVDAQTPLHEQVSAAKEQGATCLMLAPGFPDPALTLRELPPRFASGVWSASTVLTLARQQNQSIHDTLAQLQQAGLRSLGAGDAGILDDTIRRAPCTAAEWLDVHRTAHTLGLPTAAAMIFGQNESMAQRVAHLETLRSLQAETGGFTSFTPSVFQHDVAAGGRSLEEATSVEYLKTLAICRLLLDTIPNVVANWRTQGTKVLQMALRFGANDAGAADLTPRPTSGASEEDLRRIIRDAGFRPVQRDSTYSTVFLD